MATFTGPTLTLRALHPLPKATELTISYIETSLSPPTRRTELQTRYFFTCTCPFCSPPEGPPLTCGHPTPPLSGSHAKKAAKTEKAAAALMTLAASKPPSQKLPTLRKAYALYKPQHSDASAWMQPQATIRAELMQALLGAQQWEKAFVLALVGLRLVDPAVYTQVWHPVRVVHGWVVAKLALFIAGGEMARAERSGSGGKVGAQGLSGRFGLDWRVVTGMLLQDVRDTVPRSHGAETPFAKMVVGAVEEFGDWRGGLVTKEEREREELKLGALVVEGWEWLLLMG